VQRNDGHVGVDRIQRGTGCLDFYRADRFGAVEDLALEVGEVDLVGVGESEAPDASGGEIEGGGAAKAARANDQSMG
jgi:hypothetical protein